MAGMAAGSGHRVRTRPPSRPAGGKAVDQVERRAHLLRRRAIERRRLVPHFGIYVRLPGLAGLGRPRLPRFCRAHELRQRLERQRERVGLALAGFFEGLTLLESRPEWGPGGSLLSKRD